MAVRNARAVWNGDLRQGNGRVSFGSGSRAYEADYSYVSRFEEGPGTNPEELLGAAHAACFSMALASRLGKAGHPAQEIRTEASVFLEKVDGAQTITRVKLETQARVEGISRDEFMSLAQDAKLNCPVSRALQGVEVQLEASVTA